MRLTLPELEAYAFCPLLQRAGHLLPRAQMPVINALQSLLAYLYSRQMEAGYKISWPEVLNAWNRVWWGQHEPSNRRARRQNNDILVAIQHLYRFYHEDTRTPVAVNFPYTLEIHYHVICGEISVILGRSGSDLRVALVELGPHLSPAELERHLALRCATVMVTRVTQQLPEMIEYLGVKNDGSLEVSYLLPDQDYLCSSQHSLQQLVTAMHQKLYYPNPGGCAYCSLRHTCKI